MKRLTSAVLAVVMTVTSLTTAFAEGAETIPEIESGYTVTYPEPVDESLTADLQPQYEDLADLPVNYFKLIDIVYKQNGADAEFLAYYDNTYTMSADDMLSYYFTADEIAALYTANADYDCNIMMKLLVCLLERETLSDEEKQSIIAELNGGVQIYYVLRLYVDFMVLDEETRAEFSGFYEFYEFKKNQPQTYSTSSTYEQDLIDLQIQTKYYENAGQNLYIDSSTGNVQYKRTDISVPVKNGLSMDISIKYDLQDAYFDHYFISSPARVIEDEPLGVGWSFNITKRENDTITLADGRSFQISNNGIVDDYCYDVEYVHGANGQESYVAYLDGTKEYFTSGNNKYISRKEDKYGNTIFYEYASDNSKKLTRISNDVSDLEINISYTSDEVVIENSDGTTLTYHKEPQTYTYGVYGSNRQRTATVQVLTDIYSTSRGAAHASFGYDLFDCVVYSSEEESDAKAMAAMTSIEENPGGEYAELTYTSRNISARTSVPAVYTYKPGSSMAVEKTYSYGYNQPVDGVYYTSSSIVKDGDGNQTRIYSSNSVRYEKFMKKVGASYILKISTYSSHLYNHSELPDYTETKLYNDSGNFITTRYDYEYNQYCQPTLCIKKIDGAEISTTEYQYYDNQYRSLYGIDWLKGGNIFKYIVYTVNDYGDVTEEYISGNVGGQVQKIQYTYNNDHNVVKTELKDNNNNVFSTQTMEYSDTYNNAVLTKTEIKDGNTVLNRATYEYNPLNLRLIKTTDGRGNSQQIEYDSYGRITEEINADNTKVQIEYENIDNYITVTNEKGYKQTYDYTYGQVERLLEGDNYGTALTIIGFDNRARPISSTDALGNTTTVEYDVFDRQTKVTYPAIGSNAAGSVQVKYYDVFLEGTTKYSMRMTISQENAVSLEYFDTRGRLVKTAMVNNPSTLLAYSGIDTMTSLPSSTQLIVTGTYTYDNWDRLIRTADGMGRTTSYTYDVFGNVLTTTYGDGTKLFPVNYEYDAAGRLVKMTQGTHVTTYEYNLAGQLTKMTDPMGYTETYTYDAAGNVATSKDKNGVTTTYTYDSRNRVTKQAKSTKSIEFTYDSVGNVLTQKNENGTIILEYNTDGTLKKKTMPDGKSISYTYDEAKKVDTMTDYFGAKTTYTYTGGSYISKIDTPHGEVGYYYRKDGKITNQYGENNETIYTYIYDSLGRVNYMWLGDIGLAGYAYDNSGNIVTENNTASGVVTNYVYDDVNRLVQEKPGNQIYYYEYDKYNNMTYNIQGNMDKGYSYDANNRITSSTIYGGLENDIACDYYSSYDYDKNGNLMTETRRYERFSYASGSYELIESDTEYDDRTYDVWGNLIYTHDEDLVNGINNYSTMTYYADGMRKSKQSNMRQSGVTSSNTYNYYYHGDTVINETKTASNVTSNYATNIIGVTGIEARKQSGTTGFFIKDLHGDVLYAATASGIPFANYLYDAWGNETTADASAWEKDNPVRYNGQYYDAETGMYYLRARYYDPQMSRFISEDPIEDGVNWYAYCSNNPVMFVDPSGLDDENDDTTLESKLPPATDRHSNKNDPVKVTVKGNTITIDVNVQINNGTENTSYEKLALDGIKAWAGEYDIYDERVFVIVNITQDAQKPAITIDIKDGPGTSNYMGIWSKSREKTITLYTQFRNGEVRTNTEFAQTVSHEFGHVLGLSDSYEKDLYYGTPHIKTYDIMKWQQDTSILYKVTNEDIIGVLRAFSTNRRMNIASVD